MKTNQLELNKLNKNLRTSQRSSPGFAQAMEEIRQDLEHERGAFETYDTYPHQFLEALQDTLLNSVEVSLSSQEQVQLSEWLRDNLVLDVHIKS